MDIREILAAIDDKDKQLWSSCRTQMRKVYIAAHSKIIGVADWSDVDDAFLDLIDIQLAQLFDRSGRLDTTRELIGKDDAEKIKNDLNKRDDDIKNKLTTEPNKCDEDIKNKVAVLTIEDTKRFINSSVDGNPVNNEWK